jgi:hypothetical protein
MTPDDILKLFSNLAVELDDLQFLIKTHPLLAHYTSLSVLEKILKTDELWLSNPLFMNDLEEVRFGVLEGARLFLQGDAITQACGSNTTRADTLKHAFNHYFEQFNKEQAFDTYVFCMSEHGPKNSDGRLSMWRGYGGQGTGAALVFNTAFVTAPNDNSPLIISRVHYASAEDRRTWLNQKLLAWCDILRNSAIPDNMLHVAAYWFFSLIKLFALKSKHHGFQEECEWRLIYLPDRDP